MTTQRMVEADIVINGQPLTRQEVWVLRMALRSFRLGLECVGLQGDVMKHAANVERLMRDQ